MNASNLISGIVAIAIACVMIAAIIIPITEESISSSADEVDYSNEDALTSSEYGKYYTSNTTVSITATSPSTNADSVIKVNDTTMNIGSSWYYHVIVVSDNLAVALAPSTSNNTSAYVNYYSEGSWTYGMGTKLGSDVTVAYDKSDNQITLTYTPYNGNDETSVTLDATYFFALSVDKTYKYVPLSDNFSSLYVSSEDLENKSYGVIMRDASITIGGSSYNILLISDEHGIRMASTYSGEATVTLEFTQLTLVDGTNDVYTGGTPVFTVTAGDTTQTFLAQKSYILTDVVGHENSQIGEIISFIPILVAIGLMLACVSLFMSRKG